jgi:alkylhydroperoxidase/carboxymuconolactone decarboxylase family protein YurZ
MSPGFQAFLKEAPDSATTWLEMNRGLTERSALDPKTVELAYLSVLAALGLDRGVAFHAGEAKRLGASREEVTGAVLVGLPAAGVRVIEALAEALRPFDEG